MHRGLHILAHTWCFTEWGLPLGHVYAAPMFHLGDVHCTYNWNTGSKNGRVWDSLPWVASISHIVTTFIQHMFGSVRNNLWYNNLRATTQNKRHTRSIYGVGPKLEIPAMKGPFWARAFKNDIYEPQNVTLRNRRCPYSHPSDGWVRMHFENAGMGPHLASYNWMGSQRGLNTSE